MMCIKIFRIVLQVLEFHTVCHLYTNLLLQSWVQMEVNKDGTLSDANTEGRLTVEVDLPKLTATPSGSKSNLLKSFIDHF